MKTINPFSSKHFSVASRAKRLEDARLLVVQEQNRLINLSYLSQLGKVLQAGDLLVVNDAATIPSSFSGVHHASQAEVELRLISPQKRDDSLSCEFCLSMEQWIVVVLGAGSWRQRTEERQDIPFLEVGDSFHLIGGIKARITGFHRGKKALPIVEFLHDSDELRHLLFKFGRPIQYSYHCAPLEAWDQQTLFATRPVAVEPPSAAMHFRWSHLKEWQRQGIRITSVTHATGISSLGNRELDKLLPFPERFFVSQATKKWVAQTHRQGHRVIGLGTGVVRALESAFSEQWQNKAYTELKLTKDFKRRAVSGLITGLHEPDSSHLQLLSAFVDEALVLEAYQKAIRAGMKWHEYGDISFILGSKPEWQV